MAAISRWFRPSQYFSRRTSRILRMDNLFRAPSSSSPKDLSRGWKNGPLHQVIQHSPHPLGSTAPTSHAGQKRRRIQVDELRRNRWTLCAGISGPHPSEQVDVLCGNQQLTGSLLNQPRGGRSGHRPLRGHLYGDYPAEYPSRVSRPKTV